MNKKIINTVNTIMESNNNHYYSYYSSVEKGSVIASKIDKEYKMEKSYRNKNKENIKNH